LHLVLLPASLFWLAMAEDIHIKRKDTRIPSELADYFR